MCWDWENLHSPCRHSLSLVGIKEQFSALLTCEHFHLKLCKCYLSYAVVTTQLFYRSSNINAPSSIKHEKFKFCGDGSVVSLTCSIFLKSLGAAIFENVSDQRLMETSQRFTAPSNLAFFWKILIIQILLRVARFVYSDGVEISIKLFYNTCKLGLCWKILPRYLQAIRVCKSKSLRFS